jgi:hypothetical protein
MVKSIRVLCQVPQLVNVALTKNLISIANPLFTKPPEWPQQCSRREVIWVSDP